MRTPASTRRASGHEAGEAAADEGESDVVVLGCPRCDRRTGVFEISGRLAGELQVLPIAVGAQTLVAPLAILAAKCPRGRSVGSTGAEPSEVMGGSAREEVGWRRRPISVPPCRRHQPGCRVGASPGIVGSAGKRDLEDPGALT